MKFSTEQELNAAAASLSKVLAGPIADGLLKVLMVGAGKGAGKVAGEFHKRDQFQLPNGIKNGSRLNSGPPVPKIVKRKPQEKISSIEKGKNDAPSTPKGINNGHLAGKTYPSTGVPFDKDGFPIFQSNGNASLPKDFIGPYISDTKQFQAATRQLWNQIKDNPARQRLFTSEQLEQIKRGEAYISGFTWHHHQDGLTMQFVNRQIHRKTGHSGGRQVTGGRP